MWLKYRSIMAINQTINILVPSGQDKIRKTPSWMNKLANSARKHKSRIWKRYRQSKCYNDLAQYRIVHINAVKEYRKAKQQFKRKKSMDILSNPK